MSQDWFEGCVQLNGAIVEHFITFWQAYWNSTTERSYGSHSQSVPPNVPYHASFEDVACKFLPSPHHRNPDFRLPWQSCAPPPPTPLNSELLKMFGAAEKEIRIQTPNLTCAAVLDALEDALVRGVTLKVLTSEKLMILVCCAGTHALFLKPSRSWLILFLFVLRSNLSPPEPLRPGVSSS